MPVESSCIKTLVILDLEWALDMNLSSECATFNTKTGHTCVAKLNDLAESPGSSAMVFMNATREAGELK